MHSTTLFVAAAALGSASAANLPVQARNDMDACAGKCHTDWQSCKIKPDANQADCMAAYAKCVGFNFGQGPFPTTCASGTATATATATSITTTTTMVTASASATATPSTDACVKKCLDRYNECKAAPDHSEDVCTLTLNQCIGYDTFPNGHYTQPTTCAAVATPSVTGTFKDKCSRECVTAFVNCESAIDANHAVCAAELSNCVHYNPFGGDKGYEQPTACSSKPMVTSTGAPHHGGNGTVTTTNLITITTTYCPPGQTKTTTATLVITPGAGGNNGNDGGHGSDGSHKTTNVAGSSPQPTHTPPPVVAGAGRFEPVAMLMAVAGVAAIL